MANLNAEEIATKLEDAKTRCTTLKDEISALEVAPIINDSNQES